MNLCHSGRGTNGAMIVRLSAALATRISIRLQVALPQHANPLSDWSAHLFEVDRSPFVILANTASLFSTIVPADGIDEAPELLIAARRSVQGTLAAFSMGRAMQLFEDVANEEVQYSKALNRSVIGSMNDLIHHARMWLQEVPLEAAIQKLNEIPWSSLGFRNATEVLASLLTGSRSPSQ